MAASLLALAKSIYYLFREDDQKKEKWGLANAKSC